MSKHENSEKHKQEEVYSRWMERPPDQRNLSDVISFRDDMRAEGIRLSKSQAAHYQMVMSVVRSKTT